MSPSHLYPRRDQRLPDILKLGGRIGLARTLLFSYLARVLSWLCGSWLALNIVGLLGTKAAPCTLSDC